MAGKTSNQLTEDVRSLMDDLSYALCYITAIESIYHARADKKQLSHLNKAFGFFRIAEKAMWDSLYMTLARAFDTHKDSMTVIKVLNKCQSDPTFPSRWVEEAVKDGDHVIFPEVVHEFNITAFVRTTNNKLSGMSEYIERLRLIRDKMLAHNDYHYLRKKDLDYVNSKEGRELVDCAYDALSEIYSLLTGNIVVKEIIGSDSLSNLLR